MRVREQIELAASRSPECDVDELLNEFGLAKLHNRICNEIGYGDQRRLDLSLAFLGKPGVLLLDEPMAGLSVEESRRLADHLQRLSHNWGVSLLLVEHDMEIVFGISDIVTVLESGKLIAENKPEVVRADPYVRAAYLGSAA
jgi:branched-chain amino acid transport system ATP-binding protein